MHHDGATAITELGRAQGFHGLHADKRATLESAVYIFQQLYGQAWDEQADCVRAYVHNFETKD